VLSIKICTYALQHDKCNCKKFEHVSANDLDLHWIYTTIDNYTHNTGSNSSVVW